MNKLLKIALLLALIFSSQLLLFSQEFEEEEEEVVSTALQEISVSQLFEMIQEMGADVFVQDVIVKSSAGDEKYLVDKLFFKEYVIPMPQQEAVSLYLYNVQFDLEAKNTLVFSGWEFIKLNIINLKSACNIHFESCSTSGSYPIRIENSSFSKNMLFTGNESISSIQISGSTFDNSLDFNQDFDFVQLRNCHFIADSLSFAKADEEVIHAQLDFSKQAFNEIDLANLDFDNQGFENVFSLKLSRTEAEKIKLFNLRMYAADFTDLNINKALLGDSLDISHFIAVQNFDFPAENTNLPWYNLSDEKLCLLNSESAGRPEVYQAKTHQQMSKTLYYNELMSCYNKINGMFQARGDRASTNNSYIEIKKLETRRQKYLYQLDPNLNLFIGYHLNRFLGFFSDYATNPAKSLQISLYTILIFAFFYMISYSEWDGINFNYFVRQYLLLADYFMTDKSLKDLYSKDIEEERAQFESIRNNYLKNRSDIPFMVRSLGFPLYFFWNARQKLSWILYEKIELMHGQWKQLSNSRKTIIGFLTAFVLFIYFLFVLLIKFVNSFMLSLNMFLAMGFGKTPENRAPMYLTVIEGLIGWLMITIFSITLLSQLLQAW